MHGAKAPLLVRSAPALMIRLCSRISGQYQLGEARRLELATRAAWPVYDLENSPVRRQGIMTADGSPQRRSSILAWGHLACLLDRAPLWYAVVGRLTCQ